MLSLLLDTRAAVAVGFDFREKGSSGSNGVAVDLSAGDQIKKRKKKKNGSQAGHDGTQIYLHVNK
jgi:hypothetical protein